VNKVIKLGEMHEMTICEMIKCSLTNTLCVILMLFETIV